MTSLYRHFRLTTLLSLQSGTLILLLLISGLVGTYTISHRIVSFQENNLARQVSVIGRVAKTMSGNFADLKSFLYSARWGNADQGYFFLVGNHGKKFLIYPPDKSREGRPISDIKLLRGGKTLSEAIAYASQSGKPQIVEYQYERASDHATARKVAYLYPLGIHQPVLLGGSFLDASSQLIQELNIEIFMLIGVFCCLIVIGIIGISRHIRRRISGLHGGIERLAKGDFQQSARLDGGDEFAVLSGFLDHCQDKLNDLMKQQVQLSERVTSESTQIDDRLSETTSRVEHQLAEMDQLASAMEEMVASVHEVGQNTRETSEQAGQTQQSSDEGQSQIDSSIAQIKLLDVQLSQSSDSVQEVSHGVDEIQSIVDSIHQISEQTNLLALNAAIEAARAGESGRGFAVVADEVRQLASRTKQATDDIVAMIATLQGKAADAVSGSEKSIQIANQCNDAIYQAGEQFHAIFAGVSNLNQRNSEIAASTEQQNSVVNSMSEGVSNSHHDLRAISRQLIQIAQSSDGLRQQTQQLDEMLARFKLV